MGKESLKKNCAFIVMIIGAIVMMSCIVLPYATATDREREFLENNSRKGYVEYFQMTNEEAVNISLVEFIKIYKAGYDHDADKDDCMEKIVLITAVIILSLLTLILVILRRPIIALIFDIIAFCTFFSLSRSFSSVGKIPNISYTWGVASYLYLIGGVILVIGSVMMIVQNRRAKRNI